MQKRVEEQTQFYGVYERFQLGDNHWRIKSVQKFNPKACVPENILSWSSMEIQCLKKYTLVFSNFGNTSYILVQHYNETLINL